MPFVSCVMATRNRARFLPEALRCFLRQTYKNRELIVVDDGDRPVRRLCEGLPRVRYIRLTRPTPLGSKLNIGIQAAHGDFIQKIDDDDFYRSDFLASTVEHLPQRSLAATIVARCCFLIMLGKDRVLRHSGHGWTPGGTFCFHRSLAERRPFRDVSSGEDSWLVRDVRPRIVRICDVEQYIVVRHGRNTWTRVNTRESVETVEEFFARRKIYDKPLRRLMPAADLQFYRSLFRWS